MTTPHKDQLVPDLKDAWRECREAFGECNVLIVSNSAGTRLDPGELQAESVTYYLSAPVLRHKVFKPSYSCISSIRKYFTSLPTPIRDDELIIVGDRIFTDIVMANRMARRRTSPGSDEKRSLSGGASGDASQPYSRDGPLSIWTSGVWQREATAMRWLEKGLMQGIQRYVVASNGVAVKGGDVSRFSKPKSEPEVPPALEGVSLARRLWSKIRRA